MGYNKLDVNQRILNLLSENKYKNRIMKKSNEELTIYLDLEDILSHNLKDEILKKHLIFKQKAIAIIKDLNPSLSEIPINIELNDKTRSQCGVDEDYIRLFSEPIYKDKILNANINKNFHLFISENNLKKHSLLDHVKLWDNFLYDSRNAIKVINPFLNEDNVDISIRGYNIKNKKEKMGEKYNLKSYLTLDKKHLDNNNNRVNMDYGVVNKLKILFSNSKYRKQILNVKQDESLEINVMAEDIEKYSIEHIMEDHSNFKKQSVNIIKEINPKLQNNDIKIHICKDYPEVTSEETSLREMPEYRKWRQKVLNRDKVCQCCGGDKRLEVHHIFGFKDNPDYRINVDNGIALCKWCHEKYHSYYGKTKVNPVDLADFMKRFGN